MTVRATSLWDVGADFTKTMMSMNRRNFAFDKTNFILLLVSVVIIIAGFVLMSGPGSTEEQFNPDIFSTRRIVIAPTVCLVGFFLTIYAIMHKPKHAVGDETERDHQTADE